LSKAAASFVVNNRFAAGLFSTGPTFVGATNQGQCPTMNKGLDWLANGDIFFDYFQIAD
jgi:hypothetical protein